MTSKSSIPKASSNKSGWPWSDNFSQKQTKTAESIKWPKISIITPSYNQGQFLEETIRSVLLQGYPNLEYIIIDGGSTDNTVEIIKKYSPWISYWVTETDRGQTHAVNKGLKKTTGEIIGWLNSDDIFYPQALFQVAEHFRIQPDSKIIYGLADHIDQSDTILESYPTEPWEYDRLKVICFLCQPAVFFKKKVADTFGLLDENLMYCMDYEYWLRIGQTIPFDYLEQKLAGSRLYAENKTLSERLAVHEEIMRMMKEKFGQTPRKWLFAHAHILSQSKGYNLDNFWGRRAFLSMALSRWHRNRWQFNRDLSLNEIMEDCMVVLGSDRKKYQNKFSHYSKLV